MTREELDVTERGPTDEELAEEIALWEQHQAREELRRGDLRAIQRRVKTLLPDAVLVPVGTGRIHSREEDR